MHPHVSNRLYKSRNQSTTNRCQSGEKRVLLLVSDHSIIFNLIIVTQIKETVKKDQ